MKLILTLLLQLILVFSITAQTTQVTYSTDEQDFAEDRLLAEFVSAQFGKTETVRVLIVGEKITADSIKSSDFSNQLNELEKEVDVVLAISEEQANHLRKQTNMTVKVIQGVISEDVAQMLLNWTIVEATGAELDRLAGANQLSGLVRGLTRVRNR